MAENDALRIDPESSWRLLLQFVLPGGPTSERQPMRRITQAVGELGLRPAEMDRIGKTVMEALEKAMPRETRDQHPPPVSIRLWVSDPMGGELLRSRSDAQRVEPGERRRGWGFFLVQRQEDDPRSPGGALRHLIELYLYQERQHTERDPRSEIALRPTEHDSQGHCGTHSGAAEVGKGKENP